MGVTLLGAVCSYLWLARGASSQTAVATCSSEFRWAGNHLGQDVCLIASLLRSACISDAASARIPAIRESLRYYTQPVNPDQCTCSVVFYNILSVCALCQGGELTSWSSYSRTCPESAITATGFPLHIPNRTAVPSWAYVDIPDTDIFSLVRAKELSYLNESAPVRVGVTASSTSSPTNIVLAKSTDAPLDPFSLLSKRTQNIIAISLNVGIFGLIGLMWCLCKQPYLLGFGWMGDVLSGFVTANVNVWREAIDLLRNAKA